MVNRKEPERDVLYRTIWAIADELRGAVDGWDFKNYVLDTMFYRCISENLCDYINSRKIEAGDTDFNFAELTDEEAEKMREHFIREKGFFILPSELFCNICANAANNKNLNETLKQVFRHIEASAKNRKSEHAFKGLFDDYNVNSNRLGATVEKRNKKLEKLLYGIERMHLENIENHSFDTFGDVYEYLMSMYASNAGKLGGEFFTPAEVCELLVRLGTVGKKKINNVYDPACGSGSMLLKAEKILGKRAIRNGFYGQEINITTYNLCRMNMLLHNIEFENFDIQCEDTLTDPKHWNAEPFELIISNLPYSTKWIGSDSQTLINDPRFAPAAALAPKQNADLAFIMHSLSWLAPNGTAAIVCFPGILYRGGAERKIREYLIDNNYIDCIIQLPNKLFFGTPVATCIMIMKKNRKDHQILFIDATSEYISFAHNNKLAPENISHIVDAFVKKEEIKHFTHLASRKEISNNDYSLTVSMYVKAKETREKIDIEELNKKIKGIVAREQVLYKEIDKIVSRFCSSKVEYQRLKDVVTIKNGRNYKHLTEGQYPVYGSGGVIAYTSDYIYDKPSVLIPRKGSIDKLYYVEEAVWVIDTMFYTEIDITKVIPKYVYFFLKKEHLERYTTASGVPSLTRKVLSQIQIPVPSLEIQCEIVHNLDKFDQLIGQLEEELVARKSQYEWYCDHLLRF